jgi:hypothetical protein
MAEERRWPDRDPRGGFSRGPWRTGERGGVVSADGDVILLPGQLDPEFREEEEAANLRLCSCSPEMLV